MRCSIYLGIWLGGFLAVGRTMVLGGAIGTELWCQGWGGVGREIPRLFSRDVFWSEVTKLMMWPRYPRSVAFSSQNE